MDELVFMVDIFILLSSPLDECDINEQVLPLVEGVLCFAALSISLLFFFSIIFCCFLMLHISFSALSICCVPTCIISFALEINCMLFSVIPRDNSSVPSSISCFPISCSCLHSSSFWNLTSFSLMVLLCSCKYSLSFSHFSSSLFLFSLSASSFFFCSLSSSSLLSYVTLGSYHTAVIISMPNGTLSGFPYWCTTSLQSLRWLMLPTVRHVWVSPIRYLLTEKSCSSSLFPWGRTSAVVTIFSNIGYFFFVRSFYTKHISSVRIDPLVWN